ncbi:MULTISPECIES: D-alanyl-D-alanine carboxypeptidase family protein [unclassified Bacillus (in: firmicutes)]|uniref:D-alanyl-D-alanine carboxypeptidase family protein n=1 Tax=unclassified Bacillus (in: firmicutes) TaxID=185979 RepID=UPI0008E1EA31|nr:MULTISPECIES: D-alanyl-D-alanine carboxypeptidase family protein [unclassified Bacillus (in: firmicutes)]SFI91644.1 D-alanyl-D-alanine carboxypeptidase [Bacillus sp. 71mf]SFS66044.1 D-alanyl-D-alanine carboxypeptidase [Bacillus sp. 103mf]
MFSFKKISALVIATLLFLLAPVKLYAESLQDPNVFGQFAVSIDAKTGDVLYDKNAHQRAFPASITKVLTSILLMEHVQSGERIAFSQKALEQEKSNYQIEFQAGETVDRDTALMILMVLSANDVAYAIAEHVAGSPENFAKMMNEKAAQLGAKDSHFVTPSGLHDPNHYTTPYDMAMISRGVMKHPEIMTAMNTKRTTVTTSRQTVSIFNRGQYFENPNCIGGKTGFTNEAHNTLVQINEKDGNRIINVVMSSQKPEIYEDMRKIADYAFPQFAKQQVLDKNNWTKEMLYLNKSVNGELERSVDLVLKQGEAKNVQAVFKENHVDEANLYKAGLRRGDVIGTVDIKKNDQTIESINVLSKEDVVFEKPKESSVTKSTFSYKLMAGIGAGILIFLSIGVFLWNRKKQKKLSR